MHVNSALHTNVWSCDLCHALRSSSNGLSSQRVAATQGRLTAVSCRRTTFGAETGWATKRGKLYRTVALSTKPVTGQVPHLPIN